MKTRTKTSILLVLAIAVATAIALLCMQVKTNKAFADEVDAQPPAGYIVSADTEYVDAEFEYIVLNDTECSVRITNFDDVTRALIPEDTEIDGKKYAVTEIDDNGFMSSPNLIRVNLPDTIKRIGYSAFSDCAKLNRINLANVQEIDDNAFEECPELSEILIPESAKKIGKYIFRGNNTQVRVRAEAAGEEWASSWNKRNDNQDVEYASDYNHPIELETIYGTTARSANQIVGYSIASGQPRNEDFYVTITEDDWDEKTDNFKGSIFIPAEYIGKPVMKIADDAFYGVSFNQLIVEYTQEPLTIGSNAFARTKGDSIVINRPVRFYNDDKNIETNNIFKSSAVQSIVLPNNVTKLVNSMFAGCGSLTNIFFIEPVNINFAYTDLDGYLNDDDIEELNNYLIEKASGANDEEYEKKVSRLRELCIIKSLTDDCEPGVIDIPGSSNVNAIGNNVFQGTTAISELHLYDTIQSVGSSILSGWNNEKQTVYVHIDNSESNTDNNYDNWNPSWKSNFNVQERKTYYFITLDPNGGQFVDSDEDFIIIRVKYGEPIGELPEVEKLGYRFIRWESDGGKVYSSFAIYQEYQDITLTARLDENDYVIYFDKQGGVGGTDYCMVFMNAPLPDADAPTKAGYTFKGYYTEKDGNGQVYYHFNMDKALTNWTYADTLILYAYWEPNVYTVKLHSGYGDNEVLATINVKYDDNMPYAPKPVRPHYTFAGYFDQMNGQGMQYYNADMTSVKEWKIANDGDLYAYWIPIKYSIDYDLAGGKSNGGNPIEYTVESTFAFKDATHDTLYFNGWLCNGKKVTSAKDLPGNNITLKATWTDIKTISVTKAFSTLTVDVPKANVVMDCAFSSSCTVVFTSDVVTAMISGNGRVYDMCINISSRQTDFCLVLNNIGIIATSSFCPIYMASNQTLYLMTIGVVAIHGYSPANGEGKAAISCHSLIIGTLENYEHVLTITGGNGADGKDGKDGTNGKNGSVAIIAETVIIACDHVTIEGGSGGKGGSSVQMIMGKPIPGLGFRGYGGYGAKPVSGEVYVTENFSYIYLINGKDGKDGDGTDSFRPLRPEDMDYTSPTIKPWDPNLPITPPIVDIMPTSEPYVPHATDV